MLGHFFSNLHASIYSKCPSNPIVFMISDIYIYIHTFLLSSFWTSRGHRCRSFFPPVLVFNFYRA